jgi:hypothetical protein
MPQRANHRFPAWSVDLAPAKDPMARSPGSESMSSVGSDSGTYHDNASGLSTSFSPRSVEFAETRLVVNRERFATARATVLAPKSPPSR